MEALFATTNPMLIPESMEPRNVADSCSERVVAPRRERDPLDPD